MGANHEDTVEIPALPTMAIASGISEENMCAMCLNPLCAGDIVYDLICRHEFHRACIDQYATFRNVKCPLCRRDLEASRR